MCCELQAATSPASWWQPPFDRTGCFDGCLRRIIMNTISRGARSMHCNNNNSVMQRTAAPFSIVARPKGPGAEVDYFQMFHYLLPPSGRYRPGSMMPWLRGRPVVLLYGRPQQQQGGMRNVWFGLGFCCAQRAVGFLCSRCCTLGFKYNAAVLCTQLSAVIITIIQSSLIRRSLPLLRRVVRIRVIRDRSLKVVE